MRHFDEQLQTLLQKVVRMGSLAETMIESAVTALVQQQASDRELTRQEMEVNTLQVQVDDLVDGTFLGSVYVIKAGKVLRIDARPSDAIAIAVGHGVPIYVATKVIGAAGQRGEPPTGGGGKVVPR